MIREMTKEDSIKLLSDWDGYFCGYSSDEVTTALDMAIKALEQQPRDNNWKFYYDHGYAQAKRDLFCEDCISRQATIDAIYKKHIGGKDAIKNAPINDLYACGLEEAVDAVEDMPSVQLQPKTLSDADINTFIDSMKNMRKATKEESKSTVEYIDSISKPTGFLFDEAYEDIEFVETHKKLSANLQLCNDCVSREAAKVSIQRKIDEVVSEDGSYDYDKKEYINGLLTARIAINRCNLPSVTPQPERGEWLDMGEGFSSYVCSKCKGVKFKKSNFCPNCGADMREVQDDGI